MYFEKLILPFLAAASGVEERGDSQQHVMSNGGGVGVTPFDCKLSEPVEPGNDGFEPARKAFGHKAALDLQVTRHSALVKVPTVCYDDLGKFDEDERWEPFNELQKVMKEIFPQIHSRMKLEKVNEFGLVYTMEGSDKKLKPLMLTAHQDVVPVADQNSWTHPPFDAHFDGTWLWGRGASDDKNSLTAVLSAVEMLVANADWKPKRTIIMAFGFDEECSGERGAGSIAKHLEERYGKDSMAMILDEGGMGLQHVEDSSLYALPAVMEKGHVNIWLELRVKGGHSSIPFRHTGIGIVSQMVSELESKPFTPKLIRGSPIHNHLVCQAKYSPHADRKLTRLVETGNLRALAQELVAMDRPTQFRIQTSQSVDMIQGGQKVNAMPEVIRLGVNYRVAPHNSIPEVQRDFVRHIHPILKRYDLRLEAFKGDGCCDDLVAELDDAYGDNGIDKALADAMLFYDVDYNGTVVLSSEQKSDVSPVSPTSGPVWDLFSGTIQHSFRFDGGKVIPVGELMTGNTDTRHYLGLTPNIYRWTPTRQGAAVNVHTIDERINMNAHMEAVQLYYDLVRNFDASTDF